MVASKTLTNIKKEYESHLNKSLSPALSLSYKQAITLFIQFLSKQVTKKPTNTHVTFTATTDFLQYLTDTKSIETEHLYSRGILNFIQWANKLRLLTFSPHDLAKLENTIKTKRRKKQHQMPEIPMSTIEAIIQIASTHTSQIDNARDQLRTYRNRALILTLAHTGLKASEIAHLNRRDFDETTGALTLQPNSSIKFMLNPQTQNAIRAYLDLRASTYQQNTMRNNAHLLPLFARHDKRAGNRILRISRWTVANVINDLTKLLPSDLQPSLQETPISPSTFRHYFVLKIIGETNGDLSHVQTLARHKDPATTRFYTKSSQNKQTDNNLS